jgi:two-component system chemotaxis sensor kinase CheA
MKSILVIDDEFSIVESLAEILSWEGYSVTTARNGKEGLQVLERGNFDLVLLDFMMPVMDGLQVLEKLRAMPAHAQLPVVLMTAAPMSTLSNPLWSALLRKPFSLDQLQQVLSRFCGK